MTRRQALLLYAFSIWTVWVWGTRIWNIWGDDEREVGFKVVHTVLAVVSVAFAVAAWIVVRRVRRVRRLRDVTPIGTDHALSDADQR